VYFTAYLFFQQSDSFVVDLNNPPLQNRIFSNSFITLIVPQIEHVEVAITVLICTKYHL